MENDKKETFHYTYSAKQQEEIKSIRQKYAAPEEDKMEQLRRLDAGVTKKAAARSITIGLIGTLLMGFGMSLTMTNISEIFGPYQDKGMLIGIVTGIMGIALICSAYPVYHHTLAKERKRIAPEILRLTDQLMK